MEIIRNIAAASQWGIKCPYQITPNRIVVHNTANDASADNEIAYMISNDNEVSFHFAVDDKHVVQGIEENRNTWSCGDGHGPGNMSGINIEICYSKSGGERFDKAEDNAALFIAETLKRYGWGIEKVTKHQDYNGKYCPHRTLDNGWERFLNMISSYLNDIKSPTPASVEWVWLNEKWCVKVNHDWQYNWFFDNGHWYYMGNDGYMSTGWIKDDGKYYYCKPNTGEMLTGWLWDDTYNAWYYLSPANGSMVTGWVLDNDSQYYLKPDGKMACNEYVQDGGMTKYWLSDSGKWIP